MLARRLGWHYIRQWIFVAFVLIISVLAVMLWVFERMSALDTNHYFANVGLTYISNSLSLNSDETLSWSRSLESQVAEAGGWMQIVDEEGQELHGFGVPPDVPKKYAAGELITYMHRKTHFPYDVSVYVKPLGQRQITIIYGEPRTLEQLLASWLRNREQAKTSIAAQHAWIQQLDQQGKEIYSWNKPDEAPAGNRISASELALRSMYVDRYGERISYEYDPNSQYTWVIHQPFKPKEAKVKMAGIDASNYVHIMAIGGAVLILGTLLLFIVMALWQSSRVAQPLMHFIGWSDSMSHGRYREPERQGRPQSLKRNGRLKLNYRLFSGVWEALRGLSIQLQAAEEARMLHDKQREEWLSGLTHDLKTPLASVIGYSHLLTAEQYEWSKQEQQDFALMIRQKAERMDVLLQDINLTYRLNSHSLQLQLEQTEMNEWLRTVMRETTLPEMNAMDRLTLHLGTQPILLNIDSRYFVRAVENVVMNAWLHNPPDTHLIVTLEERADEVLISFQDNGMGMEQEMVDHLFSRYYRGTSTDVTDRGSGLGMAITKQLIEAHGGKVSVRTERGRGTEILFHFTK